MDSKTSIHQPKRSEPEQITFIWKQVERIATCMMTTHDGARLRSRPMRGVARAGENAIYFLTSKVTHKPEEIRANPGACLCFGDVSSNTFISLSGVIEMQTSIERVHSQWSRGHDAYFPGGANDPDALFLRFTPERGEYWDAPSNPVLIAIEFIRASVKGEKPSLGDNAEISMK